MLLNFFLSPRKESLGFDESMMIKKNYVCFQKKKKGWISTLSLSLSLPQLTLPHQIIFHSTTMHTTYAHTTLLH